MKRSNQSRSCFTFDWKSYFKQLVKSCLKSFLSILGAVPVVLRIGVVVLRPFPVFSAKVQIFTRSHRPRKKRNIQYTLTDLENSRLPLVDEQELYTQEIPDQYEPTRQIGIVYYWIDHTVQFPKNTGIQRVARQLARTLLDLQVQLIPVRWDHKLHSFAKPSQADLEYFSKWNGPSPNQWTKWESRASHENSWLLVPEVIYYLSEEEMGQLQGYAHSMGLKTAWIYHDALPLTLKQIYDPSTSRAHEEYMLGLCHFDRILPNSRYSAREFAHFYSQTKGLGVNRELGHELEINACVLPGEFLETPRNLQIKEKEDGVCRILSIGTAEPRKNHKTLLLAMDLVASSTSKKFELILVGRPSDPKINSMILQYMEKYLFIRWEQDLNDSDLSKLYQECDFTVFPSLAEGFGLPVLESLWNARPCICRNIGGLKEVAEEGGCLIVDTTNMESLAGAIIQLLEDVPLRKQLALQATKRHFKTWHEYGMDVLAQLTKKAKSREFTTV